MRVRNHTPINNSDTKEEPPDDDNDDDDKDAFRHRNM